MTASPPPLASFRRRRGTICSANGGGYPFPLRQYASQQKRFIHKKEPLINASAPYADRMKADGARHRLSFYPVPHTSHVRGGSVSRRGLNQVYRRKTALPGGTPYAEATNSNASRSSGERGLGGEALLSEKRPLPPESPNSTSLFGRGSGGGASRREAASPGVFPIFTNFLGLFIFRSRGGQNWIVLYYT